MLALTGDDDRRTDALEYAEAALPRSLSDLSNEPLDASFGPLEVSNELLDVSNEAF